MNDFNFPIDGGPMIDGTWYNQKTGDSFTVRDSFFQDNQLMIQTTDGRMMDYNMIQDYVKSDKPLPKPQKTTKDNLPPEITNELEDINILDDDAELINGIKNNTTRISMNNDIETRNGDEIEEGPQTVEDRKFVERLLKRGTNPGMDFVIKWEKFPKKQMEILCDYMGIDDKLITDYYINNININDIVSQIRKQLVEFISSKLYENNNPYLDEVEYETQIHVPIEKTKTTKPVKKTSKKK